jgi:hypothetical protein
VELEAGDGTVGAMGLRVFDHRTISDATIPDDTLTDSGRCVFWPLDVKAGRPGANQVIREIAEAGRVSTAVEAHLMFDQLAADGCTDAGRRARSSWPSQMLDVGSAGS